jgi:hypothetical protein
VGMPISVPSFLLICLFFYSFAIFILFLLWEITAYFYSYKLIGFKKKKA